MVLLVLMSLGIPAGWRFNCVRVAPQSRWMESDILLSHSLAVKTIQCSMRDDNDNSKALRAAGVERRGKKRRGSRRKQEAESNKRGKRWKTKNFWALLCNCFWLFRFWQFIVIFPTDPRLSVSIPLPPWIIIFFSDNQVLVQTVNERGNVMRYNTYPPHTEIQIWAMRV